MQYIEKVTRHSFSVFGKLSFVESALKRRDELISILFDDESNELLSQEELSETRDGES